MRTQGISLSSGTPTEHGTRDGIVVAGGYGVRISVWRGRLRVDDGIGRGRRSRLFHRATAGLKRLAVVGHTGYVSLEAIRWLADVKASFVQIDADGRVLASFGPEGKDRPSLRRAQVLASTSTRGLELSRRLIDAKLDAELATLSRFNSLVADRAALIAIAASRKAAASAESIDELRLAEAAAAAAYWQALSATEVRFARRDVNQVPSHWRTFGSRTSPVARGPRLAVTPAQAVINYLYALLEAETSLACRILSLDPGLGVMHTDQEYRDSLTSDLMEPVRPVVDAYAIELLTTRQFAARDFFETRAGVCRVTPPLTHELVATCNHWRRAVGKVVEDFATALEDRKGKSPGTPTPLSQRRRSEARPQGARPRIERAVRVMPGCTNCGRPALPDRVTCSDECAAIGGLVGARKAAAATSRRMRELARTNAHPAYTAEARAKRSATKRRITQEQKEWEDAHPEPVDPARFAEEVLPQLQGVSSYALAKATGMSVSYCSQIKRGERVPHPRWWDQLKAQA